MAQSAPIQRTQLTVLNVMAGRDFPAALQLHRQWSLQYLDLKSQILGKALIDLTCDEAALAADLIAAADLKTYCLSSVLFDSDIEMGESAFRQLIEPKLDHAAKLIQVFKPAKFRLLAAKSTKLGQIPNPIERLDSAAPWLIPLYATAIQALTSAGAQVTIENECHNCLMANPDDVLAFFQRLHAASPVKASFTWDVQNMWQMGHFPSLDSYQKLRPLIAFYHVKGGIAESPAGPLLYASSLQDASWPVIDITREVLKDNRSPVICVNPPHGKPRPGYDYTDLTQRDLKFLRSTFPEIS